MILLFQTRKKEEEVESDGPRLNDKITAETVRLVSEEGILSFLMYMLLLISSFVVCIYFTKEVCASHLRRAL